MQGKERLRGRKRQKIDEILNHFISKNSNGKVEGYNVVVKLLKRISFGMRNPKAYCQEDNACALPMKFSPQILT